MGSYCNSNNRSKPFLVNRIFQARQPDVDYAKPSLSRACLRHSWSGFRVRDARCPTHIDDEHVYRTTTRGDKDASDTISYGDADSSL